VQKIISVVGARPNFIKIAPVHKAFQRFSRKVLHLICHTGQHFDQNMSDVFFADLELPTPDFYLGVGSGSHAEQSAGIMQAFEQVLQAEQPDWILVYGDVNSTLACSLTAAKMNMPIAHVEAGLRSFDRTMPEEINRTVTDGLSELLFVSEPSGVVNLQQEGIDAGKVHLVGNVMIDSLVYYRAKIQQSSILRRLGLADDRYILVTFHRPTNVDTVADLKNLVNFLNHLATQRKIVFPVHPRTAKNLQGFSLTKSLHAGVIVIEPIGYIDFLALMRKADLVITDSGGIQEETTYLGVPCITVRANTERPITVSEGTNFLAGTELDKVTVIAEDILNGNGKSGKIPEFWDGKTAERIVEIMRG